MRKFSINQGRAVPVHIRIVASIILGLIIAKTMSSLPVPFAVPLAILLSLLMPLLWFSFQILEIDNDKKEIHSGIWSLGFKTGKPKKVAES